MSEGISLRKVIDWWGGRVRVLLCEGGREREWRSIGTPAWRQIPSQPITILVVTSHFPSTNQHGGQDVTSPTTNHIRKPQTDSVMVSRQDAAPVVNSMKNAQCQSCGCQPASIGVFTPRYTLEALIYLCNGGEWGFTSVCVCFFSPPPPSERIHIHTSTLLFISPPLCGLYFVLVGWGKSRRACIYIYSLLRCLWYTSQRKKKFIPTPQ